MAKKTLKQKKVLNGKYIIGTPVKEGKKGSATAWKQEIGEISNGVKETSFVYSDLKADFKSAFFAPYVKGAKKITKAKFLEL